MKGTFCFLLLVIAVAMGNCQNPYGQQQNQQQRQAPEYESRKAVPPPSRSAYSYSYASPTQRMMESSAPSEPIRISFSGLSETPKMGENIRRYGQQPQQQQQQQESGEFMTEAVIGRSSPGLPVPILMPTSQQGQGQQPAPPAAAASQPQPEPEPEVSPPSPPLQKPVIPIIRFNQEIQEGVVNRFDFEAGNGIKEEEETRIIHTDGGARNAEDQYKIDNNPAYNYGYDGYNKNYDYDYSDNVEIVKKGKYSYYSPEGEHIQVSWIADKDGFRPVGSHIPTPVPALETKIEAAPFPSMVMGRRQPY